MQYKQKVATYNALIKPNVEDLKVFLFLKGQVMNPSLGFDVIDFADWGRLGRDG